MSFLFARGHGDYSGSSSTTTAAAAAAASSSTSSSAASYGHGGSTTTTTTTTTTTKNSHGSGGTDQNIMMTEYYAAAICGMIGIFIIMHWVRFAFRRLGPKPGSKTIFAPFVSASRLARRQLLRSVPIYPSLGHALVMFLYLGINVIVNFVGLDTDNAKSWGQRTGWLSVGNFVLVVFLSMRNTPMGFLSGYTYERLQVLHRAAGYATIWYMIVHTITYCVSYGSSGRLARLLVKDMVMGITSGCCMLVMMLLAWGLRKHQYEFFYLTHVSLFIVATITLGLHRETWRQSVPQACLVAACMWGGDRLVRWAVLAYHSINNVAVVSANPSDKSTRIVLRKPLFGARAGQHCFLWVPRVRPFETHPFTIVANGPGGLEIVANAEGGFTKSLYKMVQEEPRTFWASVDGPYGSFPDIHNYDRLVLVAGGTGAAFTFGLATHLVNNMKEGSQQKIDFIWAIRTSERIGLFSSHLDTLSNFDSHVEMTVHVTAADPPSGLTSPSEGSLTHSHAAAHDEEKGSHPSSSSNSTSEKVVTATPEMYGLHNIHYEKLHVAETLEALFATLGPDQRVLVATCGPSPLIKAVRTVTAASIRPDGPSIELHYESFDW